MSKSPAWAFDVPDQFLESRARRDGLDLSDPGVRDDLWFAVVIERLGALDTGQWQHPVFTRDSRRQGHERGNKIKKRLDLRDEVIRLARLARLGRKVTAETLAGKTEHQLSLMVEELKALRRHQLEQEVERMSPEQVAQEYARIRGRQHRGQQHQAKRAERRRTDRGACAATAGAADSSSVRSGD